MSKGYFDPLSLRFHPGSTTYSMTHEYAHVDQCVRGTFLWRLWFENRDTIRIVEMALRALMETEAALMALWELARCNALEPEDVRQATAGLRDYFSARHI